MKPSIRTILLSTALSVPIVAPALAQDDSAEACGNLEQVFQSDRIATAEVDAAAIEDAIASGNASECQSWLAELREQGIDQQSDTTEQAQDAGAEQPADQSTEQAQAADDQTQQADDQVEGEAVASEQTTVRLEDEAVIAGTVYLEQSPPTVDIQGGDAEVDVASTPPDVTVREGQAQIVVRQASPTITIDMPQPTIRIEQPAPEIIVTMPEPGVEVASQRPQVEVRQGEPTITVTQAQPRVDLELRRAQEGEEDQGVMVSDRASGDSYQTGQEGQEREVSHAQVNMTANQPTVNYSGDDQQANVSVERSEPTVSYESTEPQVEVSSAGEPQVEWTQSGEPRITFEQASAGAADGGDQTQTAAAEESSQQTAADNQTQTAEADQASADEAETGDIVAAAEQSAAEANQAADQAQEAASEAETVVEGDSGETMAEADDGSETGQTEEVGGAEDVASTDDAQMSQDGTDEVASADEAAPSEGGAADETTTAQTTESTTSGAGPAVEREGYTAASFDTVEADTLLNKSLFGANDENIGEIGDIVLSDDGRIDSVIVEVGGFLGIGQKDVSVPFDSLTILASESGDVRVYADLTQEQLEQMDSAN